MVQLGGFKAQSRRLTEAKLAGFQVIVPFFYRFA